MSKPTFFEAFTNNTLKLNPPLPESELEKILGKEKLQPSEALLKFWKKVGPGELTSSSIEIAQPSGPQKLDASQYEEYIGISKVANRNVFFIGTTWDGTDSVTFWYEFADGDDKGHLVVFPYSTLAVYALDKTTADLIDFIKEVKYDDEANLSSELDNQFIKNAEPLSDSDDSGSDQEDDNYSPGE
ncbi:hypothetical protein M9Y10_028219 [Tritrichomonas musculus]|uniref:SMI1/KNR4 family protein n=1 Tax=Tritrichomonas musculus TaxID=1915356 RepID=A0ABR2KJJ7_9EUKA